MFLSFVFISQFSNSVEMKLAYEVYSTNIDWADALLCVVLLCVVRCV